MIMQLGLARITCFISEGSSEGSKFPADGHAFWLALDALGEALAGIGSRFCEIADDPACSEFQRSGSLLWISSDTPEGAHYFWILIPQDTAFRDAVVETAVTHLTKARRLLPDAYWDVLVGGQPLQWDGAVQAYLSP